MWLARLLVTLVAAMGCFLAAKEAEAETLMKILSASLILFQSSNEHKVLINNTYRENKLKQFKHSPKC